MARAIRGEARSVSPQRLGVFNCLNASERIRCHPEFAAVTVHLAREESTRAHREDSQSIHLSPEHRLSVIDRISGAETAEAINAKTENQQPPKQPPNENGRSR